MSGGPTSDAHRVRRLLLAAANPTTSDEHLATLAQRVDGVTSWRVDFARFIDRADRAGAARLCSAVLARANDVLATPIGSDLLRSLAPNRSWLPTNTAIDRIGVRLRPERTSIAPGLLLASGRRSGAGTLRALAFSFGDALATSVGKGGLTSPGGDLDWARLPDDGDGASHRSSYLTYVRDSAHVPRRVRCRDVEDLHQRIGPLQPRTTTLLGAAFLDGLNGRRARADVFKFGDGTLGAVAVRYR